MTVDQLHAEYLRLAEAMMKFPEGSTERAALKEQKRQAWLKWYAAKDNPAPEVDPAPIAEMVVDVELAGPDTVIVTAVPEEQCSPPSSVPISPPPPTKKKRGRWSGRRKTSGS